jgi:hypothetical protein
MIINSQQICYTIQALNTIESVAQDRPKVVFRKAWIYPGTQGTGATLTPNVGTVMIGLKSDGQEIVTDPLAKTDPPIEIELPEATSEQLHLSDILVYGAAGDSVFIRFWP